MLRPLFDRIVVRPIKEETSAGGIALPPPSDWERGEVLAVGPGRHDAMLAGGIVPMSVHVGDKILFSRRSGYPVKLDGEELLVMPETEVLGIL